MLQRAKVLHFVSNYRAMIIEYLVSISFNELHKFQDLP
jgi:hypothetical protein